jgi:hypothetical protein
LPCSDSPRTVTGRAAHIFAGANPIIRQWR